MKKNMFFCFFNILFLLQLEAQVIYTPVEWLIKDSYDVIEGEVIKVTPMWDDEHKFISSFIDIKVKKSFKEKIKTKIITLQELGGTIDNFSTASPIHPVYHAGENVIICVDIDSQSGFFSTKDFWQGKFNLDNWHDNKRLLRSTREAVFLDSKRKLETEITYNDFLNILENLK